VPANNPAGEGPANVIDNNAATKWRDFEFTNPIIVQTTQV
jgi:hypothetical protein